MRSDKLSWGANARQLEAILANLHEGLVVFTLDGDILYINPAALRLQHDRQLKESGMTIEAYIDNFDLYYLDGSPVTAEERPLIRVLRGEEFSDLELQTQRCDTGERWVGSWSGAQIKDHTVLGVIVVRDITARKEAEERFSKAFHSSPAATAIARSS